MLEGLAAEDPRLDEQLHAGGFERRVNLLPPLFGVSAGHHHTAACREVLSRRAVKDLLGPEGGDPFGLAEQPPVLNLFERLRRELATGATQDRFVGFPDPRRVGREGIDIVARVGGELGALGIGAQRAGPRLGDAVGRPLWLEVIGGLDQHHVEAQVFVGVLVILGVGPHHIADGPDVARELFSHRAVDHRA